jgi:glycosyltransferase involved in cell wall biosynthesis
VRVHLVDPSAYTPPYDHALCAALAHAGADVELITSRFAYGPVPRARDYLVRAHFYRFAPGRSGAPSRLRQAAKLAQHAPDMLRYRRLAREADVVHFQWLSVQPLDVRLLPSVRPLVLTAHDILPREALPGQREAQRRLYERMDAVVVHSEHGRERLVDELEADRSRVHVIPHGAFNYLREQERTVALADELAGAEGPVVMCFGLMRPYKGLDLLIEAWREVSGAELWVVGMPRMDIAPLRARSPASVRWVPRFVTDPEIPAFFERADVVVLPYREIDQSGVLFTALAFGKPLVLTDVGGFAEVAATGAARLVPAGDAGALAAALRALIADPAERDRLAVASAAAAAGPYAWDSIATRTLDLYRGLTGAGTPLAVPVAEGAAR